MAERPTASRIYVESDEEISELVHRVRDSAAEEVALILPAHPRVLQSAVNVRLLRQYSRQAGKRAVVVSNDQRVRELARASGLSTYASVAAYERGVELTAPMGAGWETPGPGAPNEPAPYPYHAAPAPPVRAPAAVPVTAGAVATAAVARTAATGARRSPPYLYAVLAAGAALLVVMSVLVPQARVILVVSGQHISVDPPILGGTDPPAQGQSNYIQTAVVSANQGQPFMATPTGKKVVPAVQAVGQIVFRTDLPGPAPISFAIPQGYEFDTSNGIKFTAVHTTPVTIQAPPAGSQYGPPSNPLDVIAVNADARSNVSAGSITVWPQNPCSTPNNPYQCSTNDLIITNPAATSGGADLKNLTVATESDLASWNQQVTTFQGQLKDKLNADLLQQAGQRKFAVDGGGNGRSMTFGVSPALPKSGDQFAATQITVTGQAKAAVYNPDDVRKVVLRDLGNRKPSDEEYLGQPVIKDPTIQQASDDGTVAFLVHAEASIQRRIDTDALRSAFAAKSAADVRKAAAQRIGADNLQDVQVSQSPFGLWILPLFTSHIDVVVTTPQQQGPS